MVITPLTCFAIRKAIECINICFGLFFFKESVGLSQWNKWNNSQSTPSEILVTVAITITLALFPEKKILTSCTWIAVHTASQARYWTRRGSLRREGWPRATQRHSMVSRRTQGKRVAVTRNQIWVRRKPLSLSEGLIACWQLEFTWLLIQ